ncbi:excalibur calcium-binding domain-containing protein [Actinoplanes sp. NPDC000266]
MDAYGQPVDAYGQPVEGTPGHGGPPTRPYIAAPGLPPPKPPSRWKAWHKVTLGVIGALALCLCGVAVFAPDSNTGNPTDKEQTAAAQQLADVPSTPADDPTTAPATTAPAATTPVTTAPAAVAPATKPPATKTSKPTAKPTTTKAVYYATCADAPGPLSKGKPGYRKALDRDNDGVACERSGDDDEDPPADEPDDSGGGTDPRYSSCTKAKADGYGPYYQGQDPEYDWYQDRDNDGVVCE